MARAIRSTVAVLVTALTLLPVLFDHCASSCDEHQTATVTTAPCHHAVGAGPSLGRAPSACGDDHGASLGTLQSTSPEHERLVWTLIWTVVPQSAAGDRSSSRILPAHAPPGAAAPADARTLPLRV